VSGEDEAFGETGSAPLVGERLRAAREAQGLTLEDIASSTRIPKRHLQTIEQGRYDGLPAPTYSTGFIKSWARQLGLDGRALAEEFRSELGLLTSERTQPLPYEPADPRRTPPAGLALLALLVAIVVGLGYLYWRGTAEKPAEIAATASDQIAAPAPSAPAQTSPAVSVQVAPATTPPQATGPVVIGATGDVWIKISDSGKTLFMNTLHPGDHFEVPADATAPIMTTGRPGLTTIMVGQTPIPPVGAPDRAAKDISLKPADLLARMTAAPPAAQPPTGTSTPVENSAGT
jgi:cytoskeleton protein RodZ